MIYPEPNTIIDEAYFEEVAENSRCPYCHDKLIKEMSNLYMCGCARYDMAYIHPEYFGSACISESFRFKNFYFDNEFGNSGKLLYMIMDEEPFAEMTFENVTVSPLDIEAIEYYIAKFKTYVILK